MTTRSWIGNVFTRPVTRPIRKRPPRTRPALEALEDRTVPSTFTVLNTLDDGSVGSLRWAVGQANSHAGDDTINFDPTVFGTQKTITLSGDQLELTDTSGTQTVTGPAAGVTVRGRFGSVFQVDGLVTASISGLTITGGNGGLLNYGTATLTDCTVSGNFGGGGISNLGTLALADCTVSGNSSYSFGGLFNGGTSSGATASGPSAARAGKSSSVNTVPLLDNARKSLAGHGTSFPSLVVNTTSDSLFPGVGQLSLREAVAFANLDSVGISTITFDRHVFATPQTITLTGSQLELSNPSETETIKGPAAGVAVSGGGASRVFQVDGLVTASISGLTITGGSSAGYGGYGVGGGGLLNNGTATLTNCTVSGNSAGSYASGGGLLNNGTATLIDCTVSGNTAGGSFFGGGGGGVANGTYFFAPDATLTITNCTLSGNSAYSGGGLHNSGTAKLTNCTISGNSANGFVSYGGGVSTGSFHNAAATTALTNCTISGNHANFRINGYGIGSGGGVSNFATTTLTNCTVSGNSAQNDGGGLFNSATPMNGSQVGTLTLTNCTVSGNSAHNGGGVFTRGGLFATGIYLGYLVQDAFTVLTNCTVSGNSVTGDGGGLATSGLGTTTATNTTVRGNSAVNGGGVSTDGFGFYSAPHPFNGTTNLTNCTVSGNSANSNGGGLYDTALGSTTVKGTNVKDNSASVGGGIANQGTLTVASSTISNNQASSQGGGISTTGGSATVTNSAISSNQVYSLGTALGGGIDCENSVLSLTNCTVNANQANGATARGGGIYALDSTVDVRNSTVTDNQANGSVLGEGGGIYSYNSVLTLLASNVKSNKATTGFDDLFAGP
jgi:hypothetical protein